MRELLERDSVLASLTEYAADARDGAARLVLVAGEAGVGKTSVLEALHGQIPDARWLWGACDGSFTPRPLAPVADVVAQVGGALARVHAEDVPRDRLFRTLLDDLTSYDGLTVLCLEDMHWADEATLDLLHFLIPRLRDARALVLVSYRDDAMGVDHPLRIALGEFGTDRSVRRVDLPPLSRDGVADIARESGIAADELFTLTAGNPFLVTEVLESGSIDVPPSVREAVLARVARLSPAARRVIEAAALIGARIEPGVLTAVAAADPVAIDDCLTAGALVSERTHFRFRHEIARVTLEQVLPLHRRVELHRRILDALMAAGLREDARLAHHAEGAGDGAAVLQFAPRAAEQAAALGAHREAAAQYERALRFAYAADPRVRARLYDALVAVDSLVDRWEQAAEAGEQALALWRQIGDPVRIGNTLRLLSRSMWRLCRGEESARHLAEAIVILEPLPLTPELAWAYAMQATDLLRVDFDRGLQLNRRVQAMASELADDALLSFALNTEAGCYAETGVDPVALYRRSIDLGLKVGDPDCIGRGYANLHVTLANEYRLQEAENVYAEAFATCDEDELGTYMHCLRGGQCWLLDHMGRWAEVDEITAKELARPDLSPISRISPLLSRGIVHVRRGQDDWAPLLTEADELARASGHPQIGAEVWLARIEAGWLTHDEDLVGAEAERLRSAAGCLDDWMLGSVLTWLHRCGLPLPDAPGPVAAPYRLQLDGRFRAAADEWLRLGCPYDAALALHDSDDPDDLLEALRLCDTLGAAATVSMLQARMRSLGMTSIPRGRRPETRADRFGLTRREQEVLTLVADGLTNAEIAGRLFISEKTVDNHVSSLLAKMGVESRRDAARLAHASTTEPASV